MLQITPSERTTLELLANGKPTGEIANLIGIGETEIETHLNTLFARMGAGSRTEAVAAAARRGLLSPDYQAHDTQRAVAM